jgi:hypothetical protein
VFTITPELSQSMGSDGLIDLAGAGEALAELGKISPSSPEPFSEEVHSIARLTAEKGSGADLARFNRAVAGMLTQDTQTLILRIATTADPLVLWELHQELDRRGIPPAQRWPANQEDTPQAEFITLMADLLWTTKRNPGHTPAYRGWRGLFSHSSGSPDWCATAYRQYLFVSARYSVSHWCARGLALTEPQRLELMVLQTSPMQTDRRQLASDKFAEFRAKLLAHAMQHQDRSGKHTPEAIAERRARLWRTFVLSGRNQTTTVKNWHLLTGEALTRQAIAKQLVIVDQVRREQARTA